MSEARWPRWVVGALAVLGGLGQFAGWLLVPVLGSLTLLLNFGLVPVTVVALVLGASGAIGRLSRPGVLVCVLGLVAYAVQWAALVFMGDVEGGMATPAQAVLQRTWWIAGLLAGGLLLLGGLLILGRRRS